MSPSLWGLGALQAVGGLVPCQATHEGGGASGGARWPPLPAQSVAVTQPIKRDDAAAGHPKRGLPCLGTNLRCGKGREGLLRKAHSRGGVPTAAASPPPSLRTLPRPTRTPPLRYPPPGHRCYPPRRAFPARVCPAGCARLAEATTQTAGGGARRLAARTRRCPRPRPATPGTPAGRRRPKARPVGPPQCWPPPAR